MLTVDSRHARYRAKIGQFFIQFFGKDLEMEASRSSPQTWFADMVSGIYLVIVGFAPPPIRVL